MFTATRFISFVPIFTRELSRIHINVYGYDLVKKLLPTISYNIFFIHSSQDPLASDSENTIYFFPYTCSRRKRRKRPRPNVIVPETQFSQTNSDTDAMQPSPQFTEKHESHADSDGDPPLIPVSHHISSNDEEMGQDKIDIDNLPFVRLSQCSVSYNKKLSDDVYTSESVDVPNAQVEKYQQNIQLLTSTMNNESSPFTKDNAEQPAINIPSSPSTQHDSQGTVPKSTTTPFPIAQAHPEASTSLRKESTEGTYSLVVHNMKLSQL